MSVRPVPTDLIKRANGEFGLSAAERIALDITAQLVNHVCANVIGTGATREQDVNEFAHRIHAIQHMIMSQAAARAHPGEFRLLGESVRDGEG